MTTLLQLAFLVAVSFFPVRFALGRSLRSFSVLERVALSFFFSFILYYAVGLVGFYLGGPKLLFHALAPAVPLGFAILVRLRSKKGGDSWGIEAAEWKILGVFGLAAAWVVLVQSSQVTYTGGPWFGDWFEHYQRARIFDGQLPVDHKLLGVYHLTARPPLFNVLAYFYLTWVGFGFSSYQVVASFVGCTVLLPVALLFTRWFGERLDNRTTNWVSAFSLIALLLLLHPMTATNLIYPWTRMLMNGFLLSGFYFCLQALFDARYQRLPLAFLLLAAAHLTHYSADIFILPLVVYLVYAAIRKDYALRRPLLAAMLVSVLLSATWYAWSIPRFGLFENLSSNAVWQNIAAQTPYTFLRQHYLNLSGTLIPFAWDVDGWFVQQNDPTLKLYQLYDNLHLYWTGNLIGTISGPLVLLFLILLLLRKVRLRDLPGVFSEAEGKPAKAEWWFVVGLCAAVFVISFPMAPNPEPARVIAHLSLQPVSLLLFVMLVGVVLPQGRWAATAFAILYAAEALLFYFLKTLERLDPSVSGRIYSDRFYDNLALKQDNGLRFLRDEYPWLADASREMILLLIPVLMFVAWRLIDRTLVKVRERT
jgi:hypothetical protein